MQIGRKAICRGLKSLCPNPLLSEGEGGEERAG